MKSNSKIIILLIFGFFLGISSILSINNFRADNVNNGMSVKDNDITTLKSLKQSGYWNNFSFIHIDGNWSTAAGYAWCSGNGSWGNPYTIENITIDASSSPTGSGIFIINSKNDYFIIRNVTVYNAGTGDYDAGIKLENTNNGTLTNNNCSNNGRSGIFLYNDCDNNTISGNIASNVGTTNQNFGILFFQVCDNNMIYNNTANNNADYGIYLWANCDDNTISGNTAKNNDNYGIYLDAGCDNTDITDNYIYFNTNGAINIFSADCDITLLKANILVSNDEKFIIDGGSLTSRTLNHYLLTAPYLIVRIIAQSFSTTEFVVTINVSSQCVGLEISAFSIQAWWNGNPVPSNDITEVGNGFYNISLTPILVNPGDPPILLNMTVSAEHHQDRYYELELAVDPEAVDKGGDDDDDDDDGIIIDLGLTVIVIGAILGVVAVAIFLKKKKR